MRTIEVEIGLKIIYLWDTCKQDIITQEIYLNSRVLGPLNVRIINIMHLDIKNGTRNVINI